jgi:hypothetical protein
LGLSAINQPSATEAQHRLLQHHQVLHGGLPEHIKITDNAIIPLSERAVDRYDDPLTRLLRMFR